MQWLFPCPSSSWLYFIAAGSILTTVCFCKALQPGDQIQMQVPIHIHETTCGLTWQAWARLMPRRKRADIPGGSRWERPLPSAASMTRRHRTTASTISSLVNCFTLSTSSPTSLWRESYRLLLKVTFTEKDINNIPVYAFATSQKSLRAHFMLAYTCATTGNADTVDNVLFPRIRLTARTPSIRTDHWSMTNLQVCVYARSHGMQIENVMHNTSQTNFPAI